MISNKTNNIKGSKNNLEKRNDLWKDKRIWGGEIFEEMIINHKSTHT